MDVKLHKSNNESTIKKMDQESSNKASQKNLSSLLMRLLSSDKTDQQQQQIERDQSLTDYNEEEYDEDQEDEENEEDDENEDDDNEEDEEEDEQDYLEDLELDNNRSRSSTHRKTSTTTTSTSIISAKSTTTTKNDTNNSRNKRQLNNNNNNEEEDDFEEEIELQPKTANSIKENTRNEKGEQQVAVAAVSLRQKKGGQKRSNELDSIRFSMYNIQNSQINEIDALLNELNQLQDTLENEEDENNEQNSITIKQQQMQNVGGHFEPPQQQKQHLLIMEKPSTMLSNQQNFYHHQQSDIEAIDQQFDEVLKFLAQTIDETTTTTATSQQTNPTESSSSATGSGTNGSSASPSSASLSATPNSHSDSHSDNGLSTSSAKSSPVNNLLDRSSNGAGSSNSSGIGDDLGPNPATTTTISAHIFTPSNGTTNNNTTTTTLSAMALQYRADVMGSKPHQPQSILKTTAVNKRNSSDSAFMETVSMPSSVSLGVLNRAQNMSHSNASTQNLLPKSETDFKQTQAEAQKAELIRIALEKLREANIKKLIVKAYTDDGCAKSVIIDETMKIYDVMLMLFSKNHTKPTVNYSIVEYLPKFHMERIFEDHEHLVEAMSNWTRDSDNQILFTERADKYDLFLKPELYLMNEKTLKKIDESDRSRLVTEFFQNIGSPVPEIEGPLYLKIDSKKSWKKHYCVLRQSGLYFIPKGKSKKDLQCLFSFDKLDLYYGIDWRRELKAPTDSCFALKYPQVQKKSSKYIKYVCCENQRDLKRWFNGIRIAKFGKQLHENYKRMLELIEMNRLSGRLPVASTRRLSASISSNSQRPHSSYSLNVNSTSSGTSSSQQPTDEAAPTSPSGQQQNSGYFDHTISPPPLSLSSTSLLIRKQDTAAAEVITPQEAVVFRNQHQYHYNPPPPQPPQPPQPPHHYVAQQQPVLSYTEQLKSMLQQQQQNSGFNSSSSTNKVAPVCEEPHSAGNAWNASVMAPISVSTQIMTKSVNIETQQTNSGNRAVNSSASFENMREKSREKLQQVPTALNQQQHQQQQTTTTKSTSLGLATQQQQQQHQQQSQPTVSFNLTPTHHQQQQTILATYNLIAAENVYDLPTPPTTSNSVVELLPPPPPAPEQSTAIECTPLVKPSSHSQFINQRISRSNSTGSQQCSPPQVAPPAPPPPPVPPKPHFKRLNSIGDGDQQTIEQKIMAARKKSLEMNNSASSGSNPLLINELSTILARQKKKIEESMNTNGANTEVNRSASNEPQLASRSSTRVGSPTLTKKPPPPPRSDRSQLNRRPSTDSRI